MAPKWSLQKGTSEQQQHEINPPNSLLKEQQHLQVSRNIAFFQKEKKKLKIFKTCSWHENKWAQHRHVLQQQWKWKSPQPMALSTEGEP